MTTANVHTGNSFREGGRIQGIVTNSALPKYSFNAKELDEEFGMYYYEARYYKPQVFTSRDPLMNEKPWLTPYHYCSNNPTNKVDPTGMTDEYTWVKTGDGRIVYNSAVHTDADAVAAYDKGAHILAYWEEHKTKSGKTCTLEKGGIRVEGQFYKAKDEAPFFSKVGNAVRTLDEGGHSDGGNTGRITQQDVTVGLAVISAMTGVGAMAEAGMSLGAAVAFAGVINSIDDACTNANGASLSERMVKPGNENIVHTVKTVIDVTNAFYGGFNIAKSPSEIKTYETMSTIFSGVSVTDKMIKK